MTKISIQKVLLPFLVYHFWISLIGVTCQNLRKQPRVRIPNKGQEFIQDLISKNVSRTLTSLLKGYDKRIRPNYGGPPVIVGITININNINSVSEVNMDYSLDIFFRQIWVDRRLKFDLSSDGINELVIGADMLHKIWLPDTFIANDKKTYFHKATVVNKFIRINPDGKVLYSMRMTVTAACPMHFQYFPMDHQVCDLEIESYGFRMDDIKYKWGTLTSNETSLQIADGIELPQLKYKNSRLIEREFHLSTGTYSRLTMKMYFVRSLGYYVIQIYLPSTLIVVLSWVSFWLDIAAAPARITLGMTTVLTMVTFIWSTNASLPKISYIKGIDVYLVMCFVMTFSSVIEFAFVSFVFKNFEQKRKEKEEKKATSSQFPSLKSLNNISTHSYPAHKRNSVIQLESIQVGGRKKSVPILIEQPKCNCNNCAAQHQNHDRVIPLNEHVNNNSQPTPKRSRSFHDNNNMGLERMDSQPMLYAHASQKQNSCDYCSTTNPQNATPVHAMPYKISFLGQQTSVEKGSFFSCFYQMKAVKIDMYARFLFPFIFTIFHVAYWSVYLTISSSLWYKYD